MEMFKTFFRAGFGRSKAVWLIARPLNDEISVRSNKPIMHLKVGTQAPHFAGIDQHGDAVSLADYAGRKLVLYFYPKDDTPGCTAQACSLRDGFGPLRDAGYEILGVSPDSIARHGKFAAKYHLPFRLLADPDKVTAKAYGVWGKKKFMGREYDGILRTTFLIDKEGSIERIITKVRTRDHAAQVLEGIGE